jgi:predicted lipoprotein
LFIEKEDMFFVGFENESHDFFFSQFIDSWTELEAPIVKDLAYYRKNAEEDYLYTPISVLRYITELELTIENYES